MRNLEILSSPLKSLKITSEMAVARNLLLMDAFVFAFNIAFEAFWM